MTADMKLKGLGRYDVAQEDLLLPQKPVGPPNEEVRQGGGQRLRNDPVNPAHYQGDGIECIDAIRAALTPEQFAGFCRGNAIKYTWRAHKNVIEEDTRKAIWYLRFSIGEDPR